MSAETPNPKHILVTGSAGAIGQPVCRWLQQRGHDVRGFDRHPTAGVEDAVVGDLGDRSLVRAAVEGRDTVIHLAAYPDDADFIDTLLKPNVCGLFHVCDAARSAGVRRLVLASSLQVVGGYGWGNRFVRIEDGPAPNNHYALTKVWAEALGEMYARCYGLSVICARIGWFPRTAQDARRLAEHDIGPAVYFSHDDAKRFFERCVESPTPPAGQSAVVFATSRPTGNPLLDLEPAQRVLGFEPRDTWPEGLPFAVD